jgi:hypothetical protein
MLYFRVKTATPHTVKTIVNQNWTSTGPHSAWFIAQNGCRLFGFNIDTTNQRNACAANTRLGAYRLVNIG